MRWFIFCWNVRCSDPNAACARSSSACVAAAPSSSACADSSLRVDSSRETVFDADSASATLSFSPDAPIASAAASSSSSLASRRCSSSTADAPAAEVAAASLPVVCSSSALKKSCSSCSLARRSSVSLTRSASRLASRPSSSALCSRARRFVSAAACATTIARCLASHAATCSASVASRVLCCSRSTERSSPSFLWRSSNDPSSSNFDSFNPDFVSISSRRECSCACHVCSDSRASLVSSKSCSSSSFLRFERWSSAKMEVILASCAFNCASTCMRDVDTAISSRCCCSKASVTTFSCASMRALACAASEQAASNSTTCFSWTSSTRSNSHCAASSDAPSAYSARTPSRAGPAATAAYFADKVDKS
mmetsp:Transcript_31707/g.106818  ORF Transcript_31707/g.106818 Transcript_31707/m.106818 type:complete len:366 (-) Transcript_31707:1479-2576(-)